MTIKLNSNNISNGMNKLFKKITTQAQKGVFKAFQEEYIKQIPKNSKKVTGSFIESFQPQPFQATFKGNAIEGVIAVFGNGAAAQLNELGESSPVYTQLNYPQFLLFRDHPDLEEWARAVGIKEKVAPHGMWVGKKGTTYWGSSSNKWFTKTKQDIKGTAKQAINDHVRNELNKIKSV